MVAETEVVEEEDDEDVDGSGSEIDGSVNIDDEYDLPGLVDHTKTADELDVTNEYASSDTLGASTLAGASSSTPNASFQASAARCPA